MPVPALPLPLPAALGSPSAAGVLLLDWQDWQGVHHQLDGSVGVLAVLGPSGLWEPPYTPIEQVVPLAAGARLRFMQTAVRPFDLPLLFQAASYSALWTLKRQALTWFDPSQPRGTNALVNYAGNGILWLTSPAGGVRGLNCYCASGLEFVEDEQNSGGLWQYAIATLRATDPYWHDPAATVITPVTCPVNVLTTAAITVGGDVESWPIWTIAYTVAASQSAANLTILLTDLSTGYACSITYQSASTSGTAVPHSLVVDTRPAVKTVTLDGSTSEINGLAVATSALFPLAPGPNSLQYTISTTQALVGTSATVQATYTGRYNGA
jgi:hypothetical protein